MALTFGSLFSGIGGFDRGFERAGMQCAWQVEIDAKARQVLDKHWPDVPKVEDVRDVRAGTVSAVDVICGGFPCQDISLAGPRKGLEGIRSTLWTEFARIAGEFRPRWIVVENVVGLLSSDDGRFFGNILRDLAAIRYDAEWEVLPAFAFGAPQRRARVFLVAYCQSYTQGSMLESSGNRRTSFKPGRFFSSPIDFNPAIWPEPPQSPLVRVANGLSARLDIRIQQLGNAVVPQIAEWIGRRIISIEHSSL